MLMKTILWISVLLLLCFRSKAQVDDTTVYIKEAVFYVDTFSTLQLEDLEKVTFMKNHSKEEISIGYNKNASVWCKIKVVNSTDKTQTSCLNFSNIHLDSLQFYENGKLKQLSGDRTNEKDQYINAISYAFSINSLEEKTIVVRVKKIISFASFSYDLRSAKFNQEQHNKILIGNSILTGFTIILIFLNILLFFNSKDTLYIRYVLYSFLSLVYVLLSTGYMRFIVASSFVYISECRIYSAVFWYGSFIFFLSYILQIKKRNRKIFNVLIYFNALNILFAILTIFLLFYEFYEPLRYMFFLVYLIFLIGTALVIYCAFRNYKVNKANVLYVLISFFPHLLWSTSVIFKSFGWILSDFNIDWLVHIIIYEILLFGYLLSRNYVKAHIKNNLLMKSLIEIQQQNFLQIDEAQNNERRKIANLIHDNLGNKMAHIQHLILLNQSQEVKKQITSLTMDIRNIAHNIQPKSLDDGALVAALKEYVTSNHNHQEDPYFELIFKTFDFPEKLENLKLMDLYFISLELINNARRHGNSTQMRIEFYAYADAYVFTFNDNGIGFDTSKKNFGFGLNSIDRRVKHLNGYLTLSSEVNVGTDILIMIPVLKR